MKKASKILCALLCTVMMSTSVFASDVLVLDLDTAMKYAIKNNDDLETFEMNLSLLELDKYDLAQENIDLSAGGSIEMLSMDYETYTTTQVKLSLSSMDMEVSLTNMGYQEEMLKTSLVASVMSTLAKIEGYKYEMDMLKKNEAISFQSYLDGMTMQKLGMISDTALRDLKIASDQMKSNVTNLELTIESAYDDVRTLLGLRTDQEFEVDYKVEFAEIPTYSAQALSEYITRTILKDPYYKSLKNTYDNIVRQRYIYTANETQSEESKDAEVKTAAMNLSSNRESMESGLKSTYNSLKQMEQAQKTYENSLVTAQNNLETAKLQYELGYVTQTQVTQAEIALEKAESDLSSNAYNSQMLVYTFANGYMNR